MTEDAQNAECFIPDALSGRYKRCEGLLILLSGGSINTAPD